MAVMRLPVSHLTSVTLPFARCGLMGPRVQRCVARQRPFVGPWLAVRLGRLHLRVLGSYRGLGGRYGDAVDGFAVHP